MYENWNNINAVIIETIYFSCKFKEKKIMTQAIIQDNLKIKIENKYI